MKTLVAYFSAGGVTGNAAEALAEAAGADLFEIKPTVLYTQKDLDWMDKQSRSSVEMQDKTARPEIAEKLSNMNEYDLIFLGFPIWWYVAPKIIHTFLESYDFSGKRIILFATSGGSGFGNTADVLRESVSDTTEIKIGKMMNGKINKEELARWAESVCL